jgi:hypothetical protein
VRRRDPRGRSTPTEAAPPFCDDESEVVDRADEHLTAGGSEPVGKTAVVGGQGLDQSERFEPGQGLVERSGTEVDTGEPLDVLHEGVAVLVACAQAEEHEEVCTGDRSFGLLSPSPHGRGDYYAQRCIARQL